MIRQRLFRNGILVGFVRPDFHGQTMEKFWAVFNLSCISF